MNKLLLAASVALTVATLTACGDETTNNVTETTGMTLVEKGAKMPDCTADNAGQMIYATDSAAAFFCADDKWQSLKGEKGDKGEQGEPGVGEQGPQGPKGGDGEGKTGEAGKSCEGKLNTDGSVTIICDKTPIGTIKNGIGCSVEDDNNGKVTVTCGEEVVSLYKVLWCGTIPYNPETHFCDARDNKVYKFVTIGSQTWMAENLNYFDEEKNPNLKNNNWCNERVENYCEKYGRDYSWTAAMDLSSEYLSKSASDADLIQKTHRGICPEGWHIPDTTEFFLLEKYVDEHNGDEGTAVSLKTTTGWEPYDGVNVGTDRFGFNGYAASGYVVSSSTFSPVTYYATYVTSVEVDADLVRKVGLDFRTNYFVGHNAAYADTKIAGRQIRCIKD